MKKKNTNRKNSDKNSSETQKLLIKLALNTLRHIMEDEELHKTAKKLKLATVDFVRENLNLVNKDNLEEAIEKALEGCLQKDAESQIKVTAFLTALYTKHDIKRAAQVGGSLLQHFGELYFPSIKERELRYALKVSPELYEYFYNKIKGDYDDNVTEV